MAYTIDRKGPYPNKAGEFCGNYHSDTGPLFSMINGETPAISQKRQRNYLSKMRLGKPSNCAFGTSEEMSAQGWTGLYLKEDQKLLGCEIPIETDELTEEVVSAHR